MAQAPRQTGGEGAADFIRRIVPDPKNVPDVILLTGYLGASSEEAHERLYLSPDLTNYVEIPNSAILHQAPLPKEQDAHGGVTLWVKKDAALQYKMAPAAQALANYFAGAIAAIPANAAPQAAQAMQPTLVAAACPTYVGCTPPFTADPVPCTVTPCTIGNCTIGTPCTIGCTHPPQCFLPNVTHATCALHCTHALPCLQKSVPPILCGGVPGPGFPGQPGFGGQVEAQAFFSAPAACQTRPEFCNTRIGPACHPM